MTLQNTHNRMEVFMKNNDLTEEIIWKDRKHFMWFPITFTKYELTEERLYSQHGFFNTHYDELLLYRVLDICLERSIAQKIFGTGTIILKVKADASPEIRLENIKDPLIIKRELSDLVEETRRKSRVVGKEFYGGDNLHTSEYEENEEYSNEESDTEEEEDGFDFDHTQ